MSLSDMNREADAGQPNHRLANRPTDFCIVGIEAGENRYGRFFCLTIRAADANQEEQLYLSATAKRERRFAIYRQHLPLHGIRLTHTGPGRGVYELVDGKGCACRTTGAPAAQPAEALRHDASRRPAPVQEGQESSPADDRLADEQQIRAIRKLCLALGREEPDFNVLTYTGAGALIRQMNADYSAQRRRA